jgi:predicted DCC family thiol-disulfide oxidoreductase YuxK
MEKPEIQSKSSVADSPLQDGEPGLPAPQDFPQADVAIYDGQCIFCTRQVKKLAAWDGKQRLAFISLHDEFVAKHFGDLTHEQLMKQIYVIPNSGRGYSQKRYGGAAAIRYLTRRLPKLWIFSPLMHVPFTHSIQEWCYRQIAKRRYKIAGKTGPKCDDKEACELHFKD